MEIRATMPTHPLGTLDKLRICLACGVATLLLCTLGWRMAEPPDPHMAVTLMHSGRTVFAVWPSLLVLAVISAAIGTAIVGRRLPEAGALAAAVGLVVMSLRGGSMQTLLMYYADSGAGPRRSLMLSMLIDCVLWTGIMVAAWITMTAVRRWLWGEPRPIEVPPPPPARSAKATGKAMSAVPAVAKAKPGWPALVITTVVGVLVIWSTISRTPVANIADKQVVASVGGGLFLGAMAARYFTHLSDVTWYVLAAPAVGFIGLILGYISSDMGWAAGPYMPYAALATTPPHDLARALPVIYVGAGVAGALLGYWAGHRVEQVADEDFA